MAALHMTMARVKTFAVRADRTAVPLQTRARLLRSCLVADTGCNSECDDECGFMGFVGCDKSCDDSCDGLCTSFLSAASVALASASTTTLATVATAAMLVPQHGRWGEYAKLCYDSCPAGTSCHCHACQTPAGEFRVGCEGYSAGNCVGCPPDTYKEALNYWHSTCSNCFANARAQSISQY